MTPWTAAVAAAAVFTLVPRRGEGRIWWAVSAAGVVAAPIVGLGAVVAAWALGRRRRMVEERRASERAVNEQLMFVQGLLVAVSGGLGLFGAMTVVSSLLHSELRQDVEAVLRRAAVMGLSPALEEARGPLSRLYRRLGAAHRSGAPTVLTLGAQVDEMHRSRAAEALEKARRLPVRMILPLTLLMLPGFLVLTVGPTIVVSVTRLLGPLTGG